MNKFTIQQLQQMRESEDRVEFKAGEGGNISYDGRGKTNPKDRRRCNLAMSSPFATKVAVAS